MKQYWKQGIYLIDLEYGAGKWIGVFSKDLFYTAQSYSAHPDIDKLDYLIDEGWSQR